MNKAKAVVSKICIIFLLFGVILSTGIYAKTPTIMEREKYRITRNNNLILPIVKPNKFSEVEEAIEIYLNDKGKNIYDWTGDQGIYLEFKLVKGSINRNFSNCKIMLTKEGSNIPHENQVEKFNIKFTKKNNKVYNFLKDLSNKITENISNEIYKEVHNDIYNDVHHDIYSDTNIDIYQETLPEISKDITISDMEYVDYLLFRNEYRGNNYGNTIIKPILHFSNKIASLYNDANVDLCFYNRFNNSSIPYSCIVYSTKGDLGLRYNYEGYLLNKDINLNVEKIIYVPSETQVTPEALIEAAQKRVNMFSNGVKISNGGYVFNLSYEPIINKLHSEGKCDNYFIIEIGKEGTENYTRENILIIPDSSKMKYNMKHLPRQKEIVDKIFPNKVLNLNCISEMPANEKIYCLEPELNKYKDKDNFQINLEPYSREIYPTYKEEYFKNNDTKCQLKFSSWDEPTFNEVREFNLKYKKSDSKVNQEIREFTNKYFYEKMFKLKDLELINSMVNVKSNGYTWYNNKLNKILKYSTEYQNLINNNKVDFKFNNMTGYGGGSPFSYGAGELFIVKYKGVVYQTRIDVGGSFTNIVYVPSNTENKPQVLIDAAQQRINKFLGKNNIVKIKYGGLLKDVLTYPNEIEDFSKEENIDIKYLEHYYIFNINGSDYKFLIVPDSSRMKIPNYKIQDKNTKLEININNNTIITNSLLTVNKTVKGDKYKKVLKSTKLKKAEIYDIKLYSKNKQKNIIKIDNGKFEIKVPISKDLENKKIKVYTFNNKNKPVKEQIKIENGYAIFKTNKIGRVVIGM